MKWHHLPLEKIIKLLGTNSVTGITKDQSHVLLEEHGFNVLPRGKHTTWLQFLGRQFKSPLVYILLIGAVLTIVIQEWVDMTVILIAVLVNVVIGFWQEYKSNNILEKLRAVVETHAVVVRGGELHEISARELVPGDIIILKAGQKVPADARIIEAHRLEIDEAILTGESAPAGKEVTEMEEDIQVGDRDNMAHMGTIVARGEGRAVVVATGSESVFGKIALLTQQAEDDPTPLQVKMGKLGTLLAIFVAIASVIIFVVGIYEGHTFHEMFVTAIAVAVAAIPEGLPAAISIVLAVSAQKILKRKGVVKRLVAAETLGSASVICTDKTGTLTEGKMKIVQLLVGGEVSLAREILALANEAIVENIEGEEVVRGEMTDKAKMRSFLEEGGDYTMLQERFPRKSFLSFDPTFKYLATLHSDSTSSNFPLYVTGAPEVLLNLSKSCVPEGAIKKEQLTDTLREAYRAQYEKLASEGYRVIGIAKRIYTKLETTDVDLEDEKERKKYIKDLVFVGLAVIRDPIREDVHESIKIAREAGIKIVMMTGDHKLTARAIGKDLGFSTRATAVVEGKEVEGWTDDQLDLKVRKIEIFARVNPEHKMRVVASLQRLGEVVAVTGDGINDAPALKSADIGVAVGSGSDIAKAASDLILLDDSFSIVVAAIRQGRIAFDNIRKVTVFLLAGSFTELILIIASLILRIPLPITAVMILWTNLVEDSLPNIALSFEPGEKDVMKRAPLKKDEPVLDKESKIIIFAVGIFTDLVLLGVFLGFYYYSTWELAHIQTLIFTALGLDTFFYIYSIKNLRQSIFSYNPFSNLYLVGATVIGVGIMLAAVYLPILNKLLHTVPLGLTEWGIILVIGIVEIIGVETAKWWFFLRKKKV